MVSWRDMQEAVFDAVVIGSGATGGWAAKQLTEAGMRVALLEAGRKVTPADFSEHIMPYEQTHRGSSPEIAVTRPIQSKNYACRESNYTWFADDIDNPYTTPQDKPFWWIRGRVLGGRSLTWGRQSYRYSDLDFKAFSHDGYGHDWPFSYADLAPYYDRVEEYVGISGQPEGLAHFPDGKFQPPMEMTCGEMLMREGVKKKFGRTVTIGRTAILTKPLNGRSACHWCGPCEQGCVTYSYFASPFTTIAAAQKTGRLTLITDAAVYRINTDSSSGKASGVSYIDASTRRQRDVKAKVVVLCASTLESARLLLNSANRQAPNGLANSSGAVGHYLMDHCYTSGATGVMPMLEAKPWAGPPRRPNGIYIPRFRNVKEKTTNGFIRGYGYQGGSSPSFLGGAAPGFGADYKKAYKTGRYGINLNGFQECLARWENYVELDRERVDAWGIPVLRINCSYGDNELTMAKTVASDAAEMLEAAGAIDVRPRVTPSVPGFAIHEVGTARMGNDPKTSVLNKFAQAHDVKNLFVTDGSGFVSSGCSNPTLTMMAITVRACDYLVDEMKRGNL